MILGVRWIAKTRISFGRSFLTALIGLALTSVLIAMLGQLLRADLSICFPAVTWLGLWCSLVCQRKIPLGGTPLVVLVGTSWMWILWLVWLPFA
jgi:hypothetical protein